MGIRHRISRMAAVAVAAGLGACGTPESGVVGDTVGEPSSTDDATSEAETDEGDADIDSPATVDTGAGTEPDSDQGDSASDSAAVGELAWVAIPPGSFLMGSPEDEWGRATNEYLHEVAHSYGYEIAATEVTCAAWTALDTGFESLCDPVSCDPGSRRCRCTDDDCPVAEVTTEAAKVWLDALSRAAGLEPCYAAGASWPTPMHCPGYRLPTESEWERAARAGDDRATYNGDFEGTVYDAEDGPRAVLEPIAWCGTDTLSHEERKPRPVAQGAPNAFGLYDMIGNVDELALWEGVYPAGAVENPYVDDDDEVFVTRGGSYNARYGNSSACRAASRHVNYADFLSGGLRPVRSLPGSDITAPLPRDPCPPSGPFEPCESASELPPPVFHSAAPGDRYVDIDNNSLYLMALGATGSTGPFIEVLELRFGDGGQLVRHAAPPSLSAHRPVALALEGIQDDAPDRAVSVMCEDACALVAISSQGEDGVRTFEPMTGAEIPEWIGAVTDILFFGAPTQIFVAGDGVARFDGTGWTEEVPPSAGRILSLAGEPVSADLAGEEGILVSASGEGGLLMLRHMDAWVTFDTRTDADLNDAAVYLDRDYEPSAMAAGSDGTVVDIRGAETTMCQMGEDDIRIVLRGFASSSGAYDVWSAEGEHIRTSDVRRSLRPCMDRPAPEGFFAMASMDCGIATNRFYLTETAIMGEAIVCAVD